MKIGCLFWASRFSRHRGVHLTPWTAPEKARDRGTPDEPRPVEPYRSTISTLYIYFYLLLAASSVLLYSRQGPSQNSRSCALGYRVRQRLTALFLSCTWLGTQFPRNQILFFLRIEGMFQDSAKADVVEVISS